MVGTVYREAVQCGKLVSRLFPQGAWRYEAAKRDLRLDLLRGFAVLAMVADHIGGTHSWLYAITGGDGFFVSAAEVFVFISGLLMGIISAGTIARQGLGTALMKTLQRAWTLYLLTISLTLTFVVLSLQLDLRWGDAIVYRTWADLVMSVLTLHQTFYLTDILLLYTLLVLATVLVLTLLEHGHTRLVLTGSWGLWALWQLAPQHAQIPWPIADNYVFNFAAWQMLFFTAMVLGYHRQRLEQWVILGSERVLLTLTGVSVVVAIGFYLTYAPPHATLEPSVVDSLFGKADLRVGRLLVFAGFFGFAFLLLTTAWKPIRSLFGWLLLPLGQDALSAYILHLFVVALAVKLRPWLIDDHPMHNSLFQIAGIALIWAVIRLRPVLSVSLHTGLGQATALLAAGRAYLSVAEYPGRER